jgi:ectoine hydroxylase-related dioxygenase (phytanoyl-CoA dioxygenase family)
VESSLHTDLAQSAGAADVDFIPSEEDIEFYRTHGWWVSPKIIPDEVLDIAALGAQRHYTGERDQEMLVAGGYLDWRPEHGNIVRLNDYVSLQNDDVRELVEFPALARIAAALAGTSEIRLFHDQLICKPADLDTATSATGWHTDKAYWKTCSSRQMLTAWVPFQDCDEEVGALSFVDMSHRRDDTEWMTTFHEQDRAALEHRISPDGAELPVVEQRLERGQVSFHHCLTIHGSMPNRSASQDRLSLAIHFQDEGNQYVQTLDAQGRPIVHMNDMLCRREAAGNPDYSDPAICPTLWSRGGAA